MKNFWIALLLIAPVTLPTAAQTNSSETTKQDTYVVGELTHTLDIKKAKVGDQVTLRVTQGLASHGTVYKNAQIVGRITEVQQPTQDNTQARMVLIFDTIKLKDHEEPIVATMRFITPPLAPVITHVSGVPSPGDPTIRAAGPMVDSNGRYVTPEPAPRMDSLPTNGGRNFGEGKIYVAPDYVAHKTVLTSDKKMRLASGSAINLVIRGN
jgi:hypothetical protein